MHSHDQELEDMEYWLSKSLQERIAAVTYLVQQNLEPGQTYGQNCVFSA